MVPTRCQDSVQRILSGNQQNLDLGLDHRSSFGNYARSPRIGGNIANVHERFRWRLHVNLAPAGRLGTPAQVEMWRVWTVMI